MEAINLYYSGKTFLFLFPSYKNLILLLPSRGNLDPLTNLSAFGTLIYSLREQKTNELNSMLEKRRTRQSSRSFIIIITQRYYLFEFFAVSISNNIYKRKLNLQLYCKYIVLSQNDVFTCQ